MSTRFRKEPDPIEIDGGTLITNVALDKQYRDEFENACEDLLLTDEPQIMLDLSRIDFVSSSCFGIILSMQVKCSAVGKELTLRVSPELVSVLDLLGVRSMIPTTIVHTGPRQKDFDLQGNRLMINRDLRSGDHTTLQVWIRRLADVPGGRPHVDLTAVKSIDSRCIGLLTELWVTCMQRGKPPAYRVSEPVRRRLADLNLDRVFELEVVADE